ncbi:MAG TPA: transglycosylase domain-containing protein [Chryseosolibacter sp.]|nr:transglycosylase domain-containing protein [Chryseosolibacter sp.]
MRRLSLRISKFIKQLFPEKSILKIVFRALAYCVLLAGVAVGALVISVWAGIFGKLPDEAALKRIENPLASEVYSADSVLLGRYFVEERSFLKSEEIPASLKHSLVATEDARFYRHSGIDYKSLGRVLVKSLLLQKESAGGGSTITQQLAKNLFPRRQYGNLTMPVNKIREFIVATRLEKIYDKDEILVLYLNTVPFADNTYGVKTAADRFFSSKVKDLTWDQAAVLVGMLKATHLYNPRLYPERALERRNVVLSQAEKYGYLSQAEAARLQEKELGLRFNHISDHEGLAPYFRASIKDELVEWCQANRKPDGTPYDLYRDGLKIYTSIDARMQRHAETAIRAQMKILQERFKGQTSVKKLNKIALAELKRLPAYATLRQSGMSEAEVLARLKQPLRTRIFTWEGEKEVEISLYDSVKHHKQFLQAGLLAVDPQTGEIKAYVGGIDHQYFQYDHVKLTTKRQIGSTFKPIVYAAALERGVSPCDYISARKTVYTNMDDWTPENTDESTYEKKYSMQGGLTSSVNTVSVKLLEKAGISKTIDIAKKMGISSELPPVPSIALGTPSISVMEMVSAYGVFASGGLYTPPSYLTAITDRDGKILARFEKPKSVRAISNETAQMMIAMMKGVVAQGTGSAIRTRYGISNDIAGKTGTTQSNVDGWFLAVSPRLVVGVWVGADDPRLHFTSHTLGQGAATALPVVAKFYQNANADPQLRRVMFLRFPALPEDVAARLECAPSKSNLNIFEKLFKKKKKKPKTTKFRSRRKNAEP